VFGEVPYRATEFRVSTKRLAWNSTLPAPTEPMKRSGKLKAKGGSRFPEQRQPAYTVWICTLPCTVANADCWAGIHPAHVNRTRAQGVPDRGEVVPLCPFHHAKQEGRTAWFNRKYGVNLSKIAKQLEAQWALRDFGGIG
jgi:hypothetical protein